MRYWWTFILIVRLTRTFPCKRASYRKEAPRLASHLKRGNIGFIYIKYVFYISCNFKKEIMIVVVWKHTWPGSNGGMFFWDGFFPPCQKWSGFHFQKLWFVNTHVSSCKYCTPYSRSQSRPFERSLKVALLFLRFSPPEFAGRLLSLQLSASLFLRPKMAPPSACRTSNSAFAWRKCRDERESEERKADSKMVVWHFSWTDVIFFFSSSSLQVFGEFKVALWFSICGAWKDTYARDVGDLGVFEKWPIGMLSQWENLETVKPEWMWDAHHSLHLFLFTVVFASGNLTK